MKKQKKKLELKKLKIAKISNLSNIRGGMGLETGMMDCSPESFPPFLCTETIIDTIIGDQSVGIC